MKEESLENMQEVSKSIEKKIHLPFPLPNPTP
jgi:hypothetical protein